VEDVLTPVAIESKLRSLVNELGKARVLLATARDAEVDAKHAWNRARRAAMLSRDCPKVERGGWTTAERDAWVDHEVEDLHFEYDKATAAREAAQDHLRVLREQAEIVRSLGASVRQAYDLGWAASR
jgi:hypothetical protein